MDHLSAAQQTGSSPLEIQPSSKHWSSSWLTAGNMTSWQPYKVLYANSENVCYRYSVEGKVHRAIEENLCCDHEEADSRIFRHVVNTPARSNIVVRTSDTDCLIIALGCFPQFHQSQKIWMDAGLNSNNTRRYISIMHSLDVILPLHLAERAGCFHWSNLKRMIKCSQHLSNWHMNEPLAYQTSPY